MSDFCACGGIRRPNQRTCAACHSTYMRSWRKENPVSEEQRLHGVARAYANVYKRRGKLVQQPCAKCGDAKSEMHHRDYTRPLEVEWLCRKCHLAEHQKT